MLQATEYPQIVKAANEKFPGFGITEVITGCEGFGDITEVATTSMYDLPAEVQEWIKAEVAKVRPMFTQILSNGSKWLGEDVDTVDDLVAVLKTEKLDSRFFSKEFYSHHNKWLTCCPITKVGGVYKFHGNFERLSHVFRMITTDPAVIAKLRNAILENTGWLEYKNLLKNKVVRTQFTSYMA